MSKKNKEFSIVIRFIPVNRMQQEEYTFLSEEFDFSPSSSSDSGGTIFLCDMERVVSRPEKEVLKEFNILRSGILVFRDTSGNMYQVGTSDIPARVMLSPNLNSAQLVVKCSMLQSPLV